MSLKDKINEEAKRRREEREQAENRTPIQGLSEAEEGEDITYSAGPIKGLQVPSQSKGNKKGDPTKRTFSL